MSLIAAHGMLDNAALLLALGVIRLFLPLRPAGASLLSRTLVGGAMGLLGIGLMLSRWEMTEGLIFDTRSVLLAVGSLVFGLVPAVVAVLITSAFRLWQGGIGTLTGIGVIVTSAGIGLLWRRFLPHRTGWAGSYLLGVAVHLAMLAWMLAMPLATALETLRRITLPVLAIYPVATMLLAKLLELQQQRSTVAEEVERNARRLRRMLENTWGIIHLVDGEGRSRFVSQSVSRALGYEPEELQGRPYDELIHPEDRKAAEAAMVDLLRLPEEEEKQVQVRMHHKHGRWVWYQHVARNLLSDPDIRAIVVNSRDITERREADEEIRGRQEMLQFVISSIPAGVAVLDRDLHFVYASEQFLAIAGRTAEEIVGKHHHEVSPDLPETWKEVYRRALAGEVVRAEEEPLSRRDGTVDWFFFECRPWREADGSIGGIVICTDIITDRRKQERSYATMLRSSLEGFWVADLQGRILEANDALCRGLGYQRAELLGMRVSDIEAVDGPARIAARIEEVRGTGTTRFVSVHRRKDGSLMDVEVSITHLDIEGGRLFVFVRDITEERRARRALEEERNRLASIIEGTGVGTWEWNVQTGEMVLDEGWARMLGYSLEELRPTGIRTWERLTHPDDLKEATRRLEEHVLGETDRHEIELRMRHKDGRWIWILERGRVRERGEDGTPLRLMGTHMDITGRRSAAEALRASEERFRRLAENAPDLIYRYRLHPEPGFEYVSPTALRMTGYTPEDHYMDPELGMKLVHPEDRHLLLEMTEGRVEAGTPVVLRWVRRDGSVIWTEQRNVPIHDAEERTIAVEGIARDITDRREAEQALAEERALLRRIMETSPVGITVLDRSGSIVFANHFVEGLFGLSQEEITSRDYKHPQWRITAFDGGPFPEEELPFYRVMQTGEPVFDVRHALETPAGARRLLSINAAPLKGDDGAVTGVVATMEDVTERVTDQTEKERVESQLRQAQKLEAVGRLAGGIAHDFNNMLAVILSAAEMALPEVDPESTVHLDLMHITKAAERSAELTRQLLAFSRKQVIRPRATHLNEIITGQERILRRLIGEEIDIHLGLRGGLWTTYIDPSQVDQILANLLVNARDAIAGTGTILVATDNVRLDETHSRVDMPVEEGEYVLLSVTDTGEGMDPTTLEHIFEPFFTTKEPGRGTGMGLSTVYGIVKQNNGVIHAYSEPGLGTTFKVFLPRHSEGPEEAEGETDGPLVGNETVLVVEDEEAILALAGRYLESSGYTVITARTPGEALEWLRVHRGPLHLLLTDVVMPGMNGKELQGKVEELVPGIPTLFMSGYTADVIAQRGVLEEGIDFVQKPFTMRALTRRVRQILDGPGR